MTAARDFCDDSYTYYHLNCMPLRVNKQNYLVSKLCKNKCTLCSWENDDKDYYNKDDKTFICVWGFSKYILRQDGCFEWPETSFATSLGLYLKWH